MSRQTMGLLFLAVAFFAAGFVVGERGGRQLPVTVNGTLIVQGATNFTTFKIGSIVNNGQSPAVYVDNLGNLGGTNQGAVAR